MHPCRYHITCMLCLKYLCTYMYTYVYNCLTKPSLRTYVVYTSHFAKLIAFWNVIHKAFSGMIIKVTKPVNMYCVASYS